MNSRRDESENWLLTLRNRLGHDPAVAVREATGSLVCRYVEEWNSTPDRKGAQGCASYESRLAAALRYHWWRYCQKEYRSLHEVVEFVQSGRLAYGQFPTDVFREVTLAEGVCQRDPAAMERFLLDFSGIISVAARRAGGALAAQDLEGFEAELMIPRDGECPPKLASFAGHTPLKNWLERVVHNQWRSRVRRQKEFTLANQRDDVDPTLGPRESAQEYECLQVLQPVFESSAQILKTDEALLLRLVLLDGVPQQDIAQLWGVHKSTITRARQRTCRKLVDRFWQLARFYGEQSEYKDCVEWIVSASPQTWLTLGYYLADGIRRC